MQGILRVGIGTEVLYAGLEVVNAYAKAGELYQNSGRK